jgi:molecular chaperone DnaK (HSP70)
VVRECVIAVPANLDEAVQTRLVEAAQAGGKDYSYLWVDVCLYICI